MAERSHTERGWNGWRKASQKNGEAARRWPTLQNIYGAFELERPASHSYDVQRRFIAVRLALRDIAVDLCTIAKGLDPNALIDVSDIDSVPMSPFWLDELWIETFSERRLLLHTPRAAQAFVERVGSYLDSTITEFNERATAAVKLAMFASDYDLVLPAQKELRRAVGCLLGYGWRKDTFAFDVLESLHVLSKNGDAKARKAILDLAGEFEAITEYTDGAETYHARKEYYEAIATHFPERVPACYAHLIRNEEWSYAEALAIAFAETDQVESEAGRALLETYIAPSEVRALERNCSVARTHTKAALASVQRKTGRAIETTPQRREPSVAGNPTSTSDDFKSGDTEMSVPDPSEFPPGRLQEYLSATRNVSAYDDVRKFVIRHRVAEILGGRWTCRRCAGRSRIRNLGDETLSRSWRRAGCSVRNRTQDAGADPRLFPGSSVPMSCAQAGSDGLRAATKKRRSVCGRLLSIIPDGGESSSRKPRNPNPYSQPVPSEEASA